MHAYQGIAFRIAYLVVGNAAEAEDAAQDGFVKAYRALHRFRSGEPLRPWTDAMADYAPHLLRAHRRAAALAPAAQ